MHPLSSSSSIDHGIRALKGKEIEDVMFGFVLYRKTKLQSQRITVKSSEVSQPPLLAKSSTVPSK